MCCDLSYNFLKQSSKCVRHFSTEIKFPLKVVDISVPLPFFDLLKGGSFFENLILIFKWEHRNFAMKRVLLFSMGTNAFIYFQICLYIRVTFNYFSIFRTEVLCT